MIFLQSFLQEGRFRTRSGREESRPGQKKLGYGIISARPVDCTGCAEAGMTLQHCPKGFEGPELDSPASSSHWLQERRKGCEPLERAAC